MVYQKITEFNFSNVTSIGMIFISVMLIIYHFMIMLGRSKVYRTYYKLYIRFAFWLSLWIFFTTELCMTLFGTQYILELFSPTVIAIIITNLLYNIFKLIKLTLNMTDDLYHTSKALIFSMIISPLLTLFNFFISYKWYANNIIIYILFTVLTTGLYTFFVCIYYLIKNKLYKTNNIKNVMIGFGLFTIISIIDIVQDLTNISFHRFWTLSNLGYFILLFSFAKYLADTFNDEHNKLIELTENLENKVKERTLELEESNKQKANLFINLAHETKTPLTLIKNNFEKYIKNNKPSKELGIIQYNLKKLERDMVNYLDSEKLQSGQMFYNHSQVINLSNLIKEKCIIFTETAARKKIKIISLTDESIYIKADPYAMDRIANNLIDNAIKYTEPEGEISIGLHADKNKIIFSVKDTGIGMSKEALGNIFKPLYQASHKKRNVQGIGMGLSIVSNIIKTLNGSINVDSEPGKGSAFTVKLDMYNPKISDEVIENPSVSKHVDIIPVKELKEYKIVKDRFNIFLVEDNIELLSYLAENLSEEYNVFQAVNGKDALNKLKDVPVPDLIISDIMMDEMCGYDFLDRITDSDRLMDIPFIFLTAKTAVVDRKRGLYSGAVDFISKPFKYDELKLKIKSLLSIQNNQKMRIELKISEILEDMGCGKDESFTDHEEKYRLSDRETEIINLLRIGMETKEIGKKLNISESTVNSHITNIYKKSGAKNRIDLLNRMFQKV